MAITIPNSANAQLMKTRRKRPFVRSDSGWSPLDLFLNGEQGAWFDPSDMSTMFQDAAGTIPVTGAGQPVGLILDKSYMASSTGAFGPELVTNGTFDTDSDWTSDGLDGSFNTISGGVANVVGNSYMYQQFATEVGGTYAVSGAVISTASPTADIRVGTAPALSDNLSLAALQPAPHSGVFVATAPTTFVTLKTNYTPGSTEFSTQFDNVSVRALNGSHAIQDVNDDFRPTLEQNVSDLWYLNFDGVDDYLYIPMLDLEGDEVSITLGTTKLSDASTWRLVESSTNAGSTFQTFNVATPQSGDGYSVQSKGTTGRKASVTVVSAPDTCVLAARMSISQDLLQLRRNGGSFSSNGSDQGTGVYDPYPVFIGARGTETDYYTGELNSLIIVGRLITDDEMWQSEVWTAEKTGVTGIGSLPETEWADWTIGNPVDGFNYGYLAGSYGDLTLMPNVDQLTCNTLNNRFFLRTLDRLPGPADEFNLMIEGAHTGVVMTWNEALGQYDSPLGYPSVVQHVVDNLGSVLKVGPPVSYSGDAYGFWPGSLNGGQWYGYGPFAAPIGNALAPLALDGGYIEHLMVTASNGMFRLKLQGDLKTVDAYQISFPALDYAETLTWDAGALEYRLEDQTTLRDYLAANLGDPLEMLITENTVVRAAGLYALYVGAHGRRSGLTRREGRIIPNLISTLWEITRLQGNTRTGKVRFRLEGADFVRTPDLAIEYGDPAMTTARLEFDGDSEWTCTDYAFSEFLEERRGEEVFLRLSALK